MTRDFEEQRETFGVEPICRAIGVPVSTHYARADPGSPPAASLQTVSSSRRSTAPGGATRSAYGVRKTWKELKRRGEEVGRDHVYRLMRAEGLEGVRRGKKKRTTTPDEKAAEKARDLLQRDFTATHPDEKWVSDITYIRTWQGFVYLAFGIGRNRSQGRRLVG